MSHRTFMPMEQIGFYQLKLLTSESQEEFLKEYLKYDEKQAKDFYLKILVELEKTILASNIDNFLVLCNAILYISSAEKSATLKDYYDDVKNPIRSTNLVILTCKHNKVEILKHLFGSCSGILYNLSVVVGKTTISPMDEDESGSNAFYYAIRSGNIELLNMLINWPGNYFFAHSPELDEVLSKAFEDLKLKNIPLSDQMEICVESKLIDLRFFSNSLSQNQNIKRNHSNIKERVELVLQHFNLLKEDYSNTEVIDEKFLFVAKSIAQNIHILKRKLKSTYDRLPWEEMEFCLVVFVTSYSKQQEMNLFYHALLDKNKILNHLENFVIQLSEIKNNTVDYVSIGALAKLPNSKREKVIQAITNNYPQFVELYNDYQQIRDIYSLERINTYIKLALSVSPKDREGHLIITRVLQVIGEYLKNSLESPNLSVGTAELLLQSLQRNTREVIIDLRNSLSHADSLSKRTEIEENKDVEFYTGIQNDAKKVGDVITDILYKKKIKIIKTLLNKIISSENFDEISKVIKVLENAKLEEKIQINFEMSELLKLEKLINELSSNISKKNLYEEDLINRINTAIKFAKSKSEYVGTDYAKGYAALKALSYNNFPIDHNDTKIMKLRANLVLKNILPEVKTFDFKRISELSLKIFHSVKYRMQNDILDEIKRLVWEIFFIVEYETSDIKWIEELRKHLNERCSISKYQEKTNNVTKEENQLSSKLSELKSFLSSNSLSDQSTEKLSFYKKDKKLQTVVEMLVLDIMSILGCSQHYLENNVLFLDDNTPLLTGKCLRNHLAHDNVLVDAFLTDPSMSVVLNAKKLTEKNIMGKKKIGKVVIDDPFKVKEKFNQQFITIINQEKMFSALEDGNLESLKDCLKKGADINARSLNSWTTLHFAAKGSSLEIVKFILDQNVNANVKNVDGQNPLHIAATYGRKSIVEYLIKDVGLCVDDIDKFGKTSLHYAAQNGHKDTVEVLLKYEAKIVDKIIGVLPPLYYAIINNHIDVCKIFLEKKLDVDNACLGGYTPLHTAAECGHLELIIFLLDNGADVNARNDRNWTPLHAAAYYGYLEVVNALISEKANVNARVINGCTPLHYAVESGHLEICNVLLRHGADVNAVDKICCNTPLHHAARDGHDEIVKILLEYKVCASAVNGGGITPLHMAARGGHIGIVTALLDHGVDIHTKDRLSATPLYYASLDGHQNVVEVLIKYGANVNMKEGSDLTPLHGAASKGHRDVVDILIKNKAKVNARDIKGNTSLHAASQNGSKDVIGLLIKNEAEVDAKNNYGFTPLQTAILSGHRNAAFLLIKNNADINTRSSDGLTPLHTAVIGGHKNIVNLLIKNKADVNAKSIEGVTPLHIAVEAGYKEIVETLIANDADVNVTKNSISPLLSAVKCNNPELVELFIKNGANPSDQKDALLLAVYIDSKDILEVLLKNKPKVNTKYEKNCTLLHFAAELGHKEIVNMLIKRGAKIDALNIHKETPLYLAVRKGNEEIVKMLIACGASVTVVNDEGSTPLHAAAAQGHINIVKILLDKKVDINIKDYQNRTPFEFAISFGHVQVVKMLFDYQNINLNAKGNHDWTVLHIAAQENTENNLEIVKFLVNKGSNINARNSSNSKPIHIAAREGFLDAVKFFLSVGSTIDDTGTDNQTLLHYAAMKNRLEVMKYLIAQGANVNAVDCNGVSPLHMAAAFGYKDIIEVLLKNGAIYKKNVRCKLVEKSHGGIFETSHNKFFTSIEKLYEAVKSNNPTEVEKFIKAGALVDVRYANGLTCLHYAAWKGYDRIVNILLEYKANPNVIDNDRYTPLHYAAKFSYLKIAKALLYHGAIYNAVSHSGKTPSNLTTGKDIISLFKLIDNSFQNIKLGNSTIVKSLNKIKDVSTIKAIMGAHSEEHKTLIVVAMLSDFKEVQPLKELLQDNVSINIEKAELLLEQGNFQKALFMFKTIFEKRKQLFGPDSPGTLDIQTYIAKAFIKLGDYQKALSMYEEIFQKQEEILGFNCKDTLSTKSSVALVLHLLGRNDEAFDIFQDVYQRQKKILAPNHDDTLDTQFYMALVLDKLGKYDEALSSNREVFEKRKEKNPNDPAVLQAENNIAMVLANQGKYEEALKIYKTVYNKKKEVLGMNHSSTLKTLSNIASVLANQKKYQESIKAHQELLDIQKTALGPNHPDTLHTKYNLASIFLNQAKWTNALQVFTEVLAESKLVLGYNHQIVLDSSEKLKMIDEIFKLEGRDASEVLQHLKKESYSAASNSGADVNADLSEMLQHKKKDIYSAASNGNIKVVQQLLNDGADVNDKDVDGRAALHYAVSNEQMNVINILLKHGADVTQITNKGNTPLHTAASKGNKEIIEILLQHVCQEKLNDFINAKTTSTGTTSLHVAAKSGFFEIVKILLKHGAAFNIENKQCKTPLNLASNENVSSLLTLIEELFVGARKGNSEIMKKIMAVEPDEFFAVMNSHNKEGNTLLQVALNNCHANISKMLINMLKHHK